tara:strand:+ start:1442 stop:1816 length:375 start_codon:yes stop_codon:yes gene_type:complete
MNIYKDSIENINKLSKVKNKIGEKALVILKNKYNDYNHLKNNKNFSEYIKKDYFIVYIKNNKIVKGKLLKIMSPNIIKLYKGNKKWFIYLHDKYIFYKFIKKKQSLRDIFQDIVSGNIKINKLK